MTQTLVSIAAPPPRLLGGRGWQMFVAVDDILLDRLTHTHHTPTYSPCLQMPQDSAAFTHLPLPLLCYRIVFESHIESPVLNFLSSFLIFFLLCLPFSPFFPSLSSDIFVFSYFPPFFSDILKIDHLFSHSSDALGSSLSSIFF